jgi:hypothetical protein
MRVIVCGGRNFADYALLEKTLDALHATHTFTVLMHGAARGADTFADNWAYYRHVRVEKYPAKWKELGDRKAGPIRNREMLSKGPDLVIAFPGGSGTAHMVRIAREAGVKVIEIIPK